MKKITTFETACLALGILATIPDFSAMPENLQSPMLAHYKLVIIAKAINGDWTPDWNNSNQYKYTPWFDMRSSASGGFSYYVCDDWRTYSRVGSRLCFETREKAEYAGKQFEALYKEYFVIAA